MTEPAQRPVRRRRRRGTSGQGPPPQRQTDADPAKASDVPAKTADAPKRAPKKKARDHVGDRDRGLRALVGAGPSQLGVQGALRGRDVNRPTEQELADAERDTVIVRRHWTPPG